MTEEEIIAISNQIIDMKSLKDIEKYYQTLIVLLLNKI